MGGHVFGAWLGIMCWYMGWVGETEKVFGTATMVGKTILYS